jgi:hypothetical protein
VGTQAKRLVKDSIIFTFNYLTAVSDQRQAGDRVAARLVVDIFTARLVSLIARQTSSFTQEQLDSTINAINAADTVLAKVVEDQKLTILQDAVTQADTV